MRTSSVLLAAAMLFGLSEPAPAQGRGAPGHDGHEAMAVRAVVLAHAEAVQRGDVAALDTLWSHEPDVMIVEGAGADMGWARYRDHHLRPELAGFTGLRYSYDQLRTHVSGDLAWATFDYSLAGTLNEREIDVVGKGTMILKRTGGAWRIVHSHTSGRPRGD